jgi:hypothetical protein
VRNHHRRHRGCEIKAGLKQKVVAVLHRASIFAVGGFIRMNAVEAELEGRVARLFSRRPELWRFTVRDRSGLPDHLDPTSLAGEFFIFEIGLSPRLGKRQYDEVYDEIVRAISSAVAARPEARRLLPGRTFMRALH